VLRPLADPQEHPDAFHQGLRLIALDGTRFNLCNTAAMKARAVKNRCYRGDGEPAFAQLCSVVVVELGTHQPLGAFGWKNQGELTLARQACAPGTLPACSLLLGDRLFGTPSLMHELLPELESSGGGLLFRVKANMKSRLVEVLGDGSRLVDVEVRDTETRKLIRVLRLREIHAEVHVEDGKGKPLKIRLWTNLLDVALHPAQALVELYAMRWEHELFYRELKSHLHGGGNLLKAQTPESAAQEALAMMMAASLIARQRAVVAAKAGVEMRRVSFAKVLDATVALCRVLEIGRDLIDDQARAEWIRRVMEELAVTALIPKRKPRSCTRGLRQTTQNWPKIKNPTSKPLVKTITLTNP
jgi:hypothetical protein